MVTLTIYHPLSLSLTLSLSLSLSLSHTHTLTHLITVHLHCWTIPIFINDTLWVGLRNNNNKKKKCNNASLIHTNVAQSIACPPLKRSVVGSILLSGPSCSLGYFPFQPVVHNWFIKGRGMYCSVYGKVHIKDPLLLIEKSSLCGGSGFPSKKCVNVTIWMTSNNRW